jgi:hypothetical protein
MTYQAALQKIEQAAEWCEGQLARIQLKKLLFTVFLILCAFLPSCFGTTNEPDIIPICNWIFLTSQIGSQYWPDIL